MPRQADRRRRLQRADVIETTAGDFARDRARAIVRLLVDIADIHNAAGLDWLIHNAHAMDSDRRNVAERHPVDDEHDTECGKSEVANNNNLPDLHAESAGCPPPMHESRYHVPSTLPAP